MTTLIVTTGLTKVLIAFVYAKGVTMFKTTPIALKVVLSALCDVGTLFIWELLNVGFTGRSITTNFLYDRIIFFSGVVVTFIFYMLADQIVFNWRKWFPNPVGFGMKTLNVQKNGKNYVYADSIPIKIKGDGWVRR